MKRPIWCAAFLVAYEEQGANVTRAAELVGKTRTVVYQRRLIDHRFREDMEAIRSRLESRLVDSVRLRGREARA